MRISGIGSYSSQYYRQLSTGKKINSAADNAAGLAIAEKLLRQKNGYDVGTRNAGTASDMLKVSDGALSSITDSLQRIHELGLQASNTAVYGDDELSSIQQEIDQLKDQISSVASNTQFNGKNLLDGSAGGLHVASGPDGSGSTLNMPNSALEALGIADFDVTKNFDLSVIEDAINKVSDSRSSLGAQSNALDHVMNFNQYASQQAAASNSRIEDLDYGSAVSDLKKQQILDAYRLNMQRRVNEDFGRVIQLFRF
ncbi:MAG: flagellin [Lachnospiraceae bacterium]|nr:flagellin [Lachnospiraceae bacterium]